MGLSLDEAGQEKVELVDGVEVLMDEQVKPFTEGQVVDYITDQARGAGFVIQRETGGC